MTHRENEGYYCNHCGERVSKTLYYAHKKLYYDATLNKWDTGTAPASDMEEHMHHDDFRFSDSDDSKEGSQRFLPNKQTCK